MSGKKFQSDSGVYSRLLESVILNSNKHFASYFAPVSVLFKMLILAKNLEYYFPNNRERRTKQCA